LTPARDGFAGAMKMINGETAGYKGGFPTNTTIGTVATNARLTKAMATRVSIMAHDGYARTINTVHTLGDGDVIFTLAAGTVDADTDRVGALAAWVMAQAVVNAVRAAASLFGVPASCDLFRT